MNLVFVGSIGSTYQWAGTSGDGIIMQAGSLVIEPIELDVTFMNKKENEVIEFLEDLVGLMSHWAMPPDERKRLLNRLAEMRKQKGK